LLRLLLLRKFVRAEAASLEPGEVHRSPSRQGECVEALRSGLAFFEAPIGMIVNSSMHRVKGDHAS